MSPPPPRAFHLMLKPRGPVCNLDCSYCFYLEKLDLYPGSKFRMSDEVLEELVRSYIAAQQVPEVVFGWQGGEPTLMGIPFFERAVELQQRHGRPGMRIVNTIQTNGVLLDDAWCRFFREHEFLVGISIDGPPDLHDRYRVDRGGRPTAERVLAGLERLKRHGVEFNVLSCVHAANQDEPLAVYRYLRDEVGAAFVQLIPVVERDPGAPGGVSGQSVDPEAFGRYLIAVFDEWVRRDVGEVFVQTFDAALSAWYGAGHPVCIFAPTCGNALALEHNGDLYSCDHFVNPGHHLGSLMEVSLADMVDSRRQRKFGADKESTLPGQCRRCEVRFACNGGCPKNRFTETPEGDPGLNYLCAGYLAFFRHIDGPMQFMADELRADRAPANVMRWVAERDRE